MRTPRAVNSLIDDLFERKYRKVGQEKNALGFFSRRVFCFNIVTPGKGSKYREFYDLSGRITCMPKTHRSTLVITGIHLNLLFLLFKSQGLFLRLSSLLQ